MRSRYRRDKSDNLCAEARHAFPIGQAVRERRLALRLSPVELAAWTGTTQRDQLVHALRGQMCSVTDQAFPIGRWEPTLPQATADLIDP